MEEDEDYVYYYEEESNKEWDKPKPHGDYGGRYRCPNCGSYNTNQSTYADWCNSCGDSNGY